MLTGQGGDEVVVLISSLLKVKAMKVVAVLISSLLMLKAINVHLVLTILVS